MSTRLILCLSLLLLLTGGLAQAGDAASGGLEAQRDTFLAAEKALKQNRLKEYRRLKQRLAGYPLLPYLTYQELTRQISATKKHQADAFLRANTDTPLADRFTRRWLDELWRRGDLKGYLALYRRGSNTRRHCRYLDALLRTGNKEQALAEVPELWLTGRSLPKACDPVLETWRQAGRLTPELVWGRIELAMKARQTRLARYLGRYLPSDAERRWLDRWLSLDRRPATVAELETQLRDQPHPYRETMLLHGVERLARKDLNAATAVWRRLADHYSFDDDQRYRAERSLVRAALSQEPPDLLERLDTFQPRPDDTSLLEQRLRAALKRQDWPRLQAWIGRLPPRLADSERWRYWLARALEQQGHRDQAEAIYAALADNRSYHGFLAADRLGLPYNLSHTPLEVAPAEVDRVARQPGIQRARELFHLERLLDARREWRIATRDLDNDQLQAASALARTWGWHTQAIFTLARTGYWEDLKLRFPVEHREVVDRASRKRRLDESWVFAVIRQESAFAADARSSAGAMGLMQLMPGTARLVARKLKRRTPKTRELLQPGTNIDLGTAYLSQVLERLHDNPVLATSAYNAGPHRVKRWLPEQSQPADLWIETIPFRETRRYTQRVLTYAVIYDRRLGRKESRIAARMPDVQPRPIATASDAGRPAGPGAPPG